MGRTKKLGMVVRAALTKAKQRVGDDLLPQKHAPDIAEYGQRAATIRAVGECLPWLFGKDGNPEKLDLFVRHTADFPLEILQAACERVMRREKVGNVLGAITEAAQDIKAGAVERQRTGRVPEERQLTEKKPDPEKVKAWIQNFRAKHES